MALMDDDMDKVWRSIKDAIQDPLKKPEGLSTAYAVYDLGTDSGGDQLADKDAVLRDFSERRFTGRSSLTKRLAEENIPSFCAWAMDERSVNFLDVKKAEDGKEFQPTVRNEFERKIRMEIREDTIKRYFHHYLIAGVTIESSGLNDVFFVPMCMEDVTIDYKNNEYAYWKRDLDRDYLIMELSKEEWESNKDIEDLSTFIDETKDKVEVTYGMYKHGFEEYYEFIEMNDVCFRKMHTKPVIQWQYFRQHPKTGMPMGIYALCRAEEWETQRVYDAITSRIVRAIKASLLMRSRGLNTRKLNEFKNARAIRIDANDLPGGKDDFIWVPSKIEDIPAFREDIEEQYKVARSITGLYQAPTTISNQNTPVAEAVMVYQNTTKSQREAINGFTRILGVVFEIVALRDFGVMLRSDVVSNPLDEELRIAGVNELLVPMLEMLEKDKTGAILGGLFNVKGFHKLVRYKAAYHKLPDEIFETPDETLLMTKERKLAAQQKEEDAAMILAKAEMQKARAENRGIDARYFATNAQIRMKDSDIILGLLELEKEYVKLDKESELGLVREMIKVMEAQIKITTKHTEEANSEKPDA